MKRLCKTNFGCGKRAKLSNLRNVRGVGVVNKNTWKVRCFGRYLKELPILDIVEVINANTCWKEVKLSNNETVTFGLNRSDKDLVSVSGLW